MRPRALSFDRYPLGALAVLAAVIGVVVVRALPLDPHLNPDSWAFESLAHSLLAGHGLVYREPMLQGLDLYAFRAPGYAVFVALGLLLGGVGSVIVLQGALNGISAAIVGGIAGRLAGPRAAWIAFALRLAWPAGWLHARLETSEILFEFLGVLATALVVESVERRRVGWSVVAGLTCAAALLTRPVGLANIAVLGLWLALRFPRAAVPFALAALVAWAPWPARNFARLHALVPFSTLGGATTWAGTQPNGEVGPAFTWMSQHVELGEVALDRHFMELARANVRAHPVDAAGSSAHWALLYLGPLRGRYVSLWVHRFALMAALAGLLLAGTGRRLALPGLFWAAQGALLLPVIIIERYRFPAEWCVVVAAAVGLVGLGGRLGARRMGWLTVLALALCFAGSWITAAR